MDAAMVDVRDRAKVMNVGRLQAITANLSVKSCRLIAGMQ